MNIQEKMDELIKQYLDFCCETENRYEGITAFVLAKTNIKKLEAKVDDNYKNLRVADLIIVLNNMRGEWGEALNKFTQVELPI